jgi:hypothetical protein
MVAVTVARWLRMVAALFFNGCAMVALFRFLHGCAAVAQGGRNHKKLNDSIGATMGF